MYNRMVESSVYDEISLISKGLYRIVSDIVGPECIVKLRRRKWCITDTLRNCESTPKQIMITSGSRAEGFYFKTSDFDYIFLDRDAIVLTSLFQMIYNSCYKNRTVLLMENTNPGFAFIKCLSCHLNNENVYNSLIMRGSCFYVSCEILRESFLPTNNSSSHGPCQTTSMFGVENDRTYTLKCSTWPKQAYSFIYRALENCWPTYDTLIDICKKTYGKKHVSL